MGEGVTIHKVTQVFEVEIERDDEREKEERYEAWCGRLSGCRVYASSKAKALRKIRLAIGLWLDLADRQVHDDPRGVTEWLDM